MHAFCNQLRFLKALNHQQHLRTLLTLGMIILKQTNSYAVTGLSAFLQLSTS